MTTAMTTTTTTTDQTTAAAQSAQRLQAAKDQIAAQRGRILHLQGKQQAFAGERRVLALREQRLRMNVATAEQALTAAQEAVRHAQAGALIDGSAADVAGAEANVATTRQQLQAAQAELDTALAPTGAIGAARADLQARQAQVDQQLADAQQLVSSLERHAHEAHAAHGAAIVGELAGEYDAAIARLQAAYAEADAAREELATVGRRVVAAFGDVGLPAGSWHTSAHTGMAQPAADKQIRAALERQVPLALGRAVDIMGAFDALMAALIQGAGRVPAQIGPHFLRYVMNLEHNVFIQFWTGSLRIGGAQREVNVFRQMRGQVKPALAFTLEKAQPAAKPEQPSQAS